MMHKINRDTFSPDLIFKKFYILVPGNVMHKDLQSKMTGWFMYH